MSSEPRPFDGRLPPPEFANIETTLYCNLRCPMCLQFNSGTTVTGPHMAPAVFQDVSQAVFPFVKRWQPSCSGEPTMSKDFYGMLKRAGEFGVMADVVTNATLLTPRMIDALVPAVANVVFSFDGHDAETFESIRVGADFRRVVANIKALVTRCRETLPEDRQPVFGLNCTLMEKNVRGFAEIVELAARELGVDFVQAGHVHPITSELKQQSLVHHQELAKREFDRACAKAKEVGIALTIGSLDQIKVETVATDGEARAWSTQDGVVAGLELREINADKRRPLPELSSNSPAYESIMRRRQEAYANSTFPPRRPANLQAPKRESIWYCDYLWNRMFITLSRLVRICCIPGVPIVGRLEGRLDEVWNNDNCRVMRQRMAMKDPVPACRGCGEICEITDPVTIDYLLQGMEIPTPSDVPALPGALDPTRTVKVDDEAAGWAPEMLPTLAGREAVQYPGIPGKISRHDPALASNKPEALDHYRRTGTEACAFLKDALETSSRSVEDVESLLEFGCGFGRVTRALVQTFSKEKISVYDRDPLAVAFCADEFKVRPLFTSNQCDTIPFAGRWVPFESYDLIWLGTTLNSFSPGYINELFLLLNDVLRSDGILVMATFGERSLDLLREGVYGERYKSFQPQIMRDLEDTGISFIPNGRAGNLGMTWFCQSYLEALVDRLPQLSLERLELRPAAWDDHLDVVSYRRKA